MSDQAKADSPRRRLMDPYTPQTQAKENGILLCLDNGVRIECGGYPKPGAYLAVVDRDGYEIGYWNADEWQKHPTVVMADILRTAAEGKELTGTCGYSQFPQGVVPTRENPTCVLERNHQGACRFTKTP